MEKLEKLKKEVKMELNSLRSWELKTTTMKKLFMVLAATIICGATTFTSCTNDVATEYKDLQPK